MLRRPMKIALLVLALAPLAGCFSVEQPPCAFACGDNGKCPDDYLCMSDGYCHLHGTGVCLFSDAAPAPDMATATAPDDLSAAVDMSMPDLQPAPDLRAPTAPADASMPVDATPPANVDLL
jgi:hypothetical protein